MGWETEAQNLAPGEVVPLELEACGLLHFVASIGVQGAKPTTGHLTFGPCFILRSEYVHVLDGHGFSNGGTIPGEDLEVAVPNGEQSYCVPFYGQCPDRWLSVRNTTDRTLRVLIHYQREAITATEK